MFASNLLAGKRILITGGGSGLGKSLGGRYLELGARLVICGRRAEILDQAAAELRAATGGEIATFICDVRDADAVDAMMADIWRDGPLDGLVNNAAGNFIARSETLSSRAVDAVFDIVLHGTAYCTIACGRRWIDGGLPGSILNIISTGAWTGAAFTMPSAAAKAGVLSMTRSLAVEWGPKGIRLVAVAPGLFPTEGAGSRLYAAENPMEAHAVDVPLRRVGEHAELANLCAYLMSDMAAYISGDCITIDGGRWLHGVDGVRTRTLSEWSDEAWAAMRPNRTKPA